MGLKLRFETKNQVMAARVKQIGVMMNDMLLPKPGIKPSAVQKTPAVPETS